jgi:hypothetical protein
MEDGTFLKNVHLSTCGASYLEINTFSPFITECHKHNPFEQQNFCFKNIKKGFLIPSVKNPGIMYIA